ncbi:MAG: hypothetical protein ABR498_08930, partial [Candidatus Dormibacteria bacterium]
LTGLEGRYQLGVLMLPGELSPGAASVATTLESSGASALEPAGHAWEWGGATWRCLSYRSQSSGAASCAVLVTGTSGCVLVLGDAGTGDQEELAAIYAASVRADVLVAEPGGSLSPALLAAVRPQTVVVPLASGGSTAAAPPGTAVLRTSTAGDVRFVEMAGGLVQDG